MADNTSLPERRISATVQTISYLPSSTHPFHTLDLWYQNPSENALWVIFIHGGAWRDPTQTKLLGHPLLTHLLDSNKLLNASSIDYRLSPHPFHPPVSETIQHPGHIQDVISALKFLTEKFNMKKYILIGHSAGATLALQSLYVGYTTTAGAGAVCLEWGNDISNLSPPPPSPQALICLEGIYAISALVEEYPDYISLIEGAFGPAPVDNEQRKTHPWETASPTMDPVCSAIGKWFGEKVTGKIVLVQSKNDELLSHRQTRLMERALAEGFPAEGRVGVIVGNFGGHDDVLTKNVIWGIVDVVVLEVITALT